MDIPLDEVIHFDCVTHHPQTSAVKDADGAVTFAVYEEATDTDIGVGGSMTKRTSLTGNYRGSFTASAANGFEVGKWYSIIGSATVNGRDGKAILKHFRIVLAESVVGEPKVDVGALGGVAQSLTDLKDFADDGYDPSTNKVQGVVLVDTLTTYTGNTVQTGDSFARIGATGSGLTSLATQASVDVIDGIVDTILVDTNELQGDWTNGGRLDLIVDAILDDTDLIDDATSGLAKIATDAAAILVDTGTTLDGRIPAALVGGRMDANMGAISADATAADNAEAFFDGTGYAGTGNVIPTVTTVTTVTNLTNAPTSGDLTATMKTSVNAEVLDVLNVDTFAEPSAVPAATSSIFAKIRWLFALARNKVTQTATTQALRNDADDANIATATVGDDGATATRGEWS